MIFLDTNIIIELLTGDRDMTGGWTEARFEVLARDHQFICNLIVVAEVAAGLRRPGPLLNKLAELSVAVVDLDDATAFRAADAFREYRRRGGARATILPDFLIAAHAVTLDAELMTRDRRLGSYFPDLILITPEAHP